MQCVTSVVLHLLVEFLSVPFAIEKGGLLVVSKEHSWRNALISIEIALRFLPPAPLHFRSLFSRTNTRMKEEKLSEARVEKEGKLITYFESIQVVYRNLSSTLYQRVCRFRCCSFLQTRSTLMLPSFALFFCYVLCANAVISVLCAKFNFLRI